MRVIRSAAILLLLLFLAACGGSGGAAEDMAAEGDRSGVAVTGGDDSGTESAGAESAVGFSGTAAQGEASAEEPAADSDPGIEPPEIDPLPDVRTGDRVIKEGTISIEVDKGQFDTAYRAVIESADTYGGDVVGSSTSTSDNGDTFGSVTVRVPVSNFEDLVLGVGDIGEIRNRDVDSQDVSAEFTDLESRLRHLQAQERFYLGLFDKADSVEDAIRVQQQLNGIQGAIEKIQGRMNFLDDRTSFSTLTVELFEPGAGAPLLEPEDPPTDRPTFTRYWDTARDAFVNVVGAMLVVLVFTAPLLVPALIVGALWLSHRRQRRPVASPPPARQDEPETVGAEH